MYPNRKMATATERDLASEEGVDLGLEVFVT